jgi:hypothetical protein
MGDVRTAPGIVAHRPEDVKNPGIPALGETFFGKTVLFYLN